MKFEFDSLKYVKMLQSKGLNTDTAEAVVELLTETDIKNLYNISEINNMLSESVKNTIAECRREFDKRMDAYEKRTQSIENRLDTSISELRSEIRLGRRWMVGTIITSTVALAGYLSTLIHLTH